LVNGAAGLELTETTLQACGYGALRVQPVRGPWGCPDTGGRGKEELRAFYRGVFIRSWPDDLQMLPVNRVVGDDQLVDEVHAGFTHSKQMDWLLPGIAPTNRKVDVDFVVVVQFRDDCIACERIYWDHATVLRQVGLL
jgi:carboxymethylenebutenolidase